MPLARREGAVIRGMFELSAWKIERHIVRIEWNLAGATVFHRELNVVR